MFHFVIPLEEIHVDSAGHEIHNFRHDLFALIFGYHVQIVEQFCKERGGRREAGRYNEGRETQSAGKYSKVPPPHSTFPLDGKMLPPRSPLRFLLPKAA